MADIHERFVDEGQTWNDFAEVMYVRCPRCGRCAEVRRIANDEQEIEAYTAKYGGSKNFLRIFSPRKLSCGFCGYNRVRNERSLSRRGPYDWYFGVPLWLQTRCCGDVLWVLNEEHLDFLEGYVGAKQRVKAGEEAILRNSTMASRLPRWMKSAKNREEVLRGIGKLRVLLKEGGII
jgi:hypothetical protein